MTITLDHQTGSATEMTTDAIHIQLSNAQWRDGYGQSSAGYAPLSSYTPALP